MLMRLWSFLTRGELVWLRDNDGELTLSIARTNPWGERVAKRYWPFRIRDVILRDDGTVDGGYVKFWKPAGPRNGR